MILPDPIFNDMLVAKFINNIMNNGKKSLAEKIFYTSIKKIEKSAKSNEGLEIFKKAINNVCPMLEVKSKRIGGATYQVPIEVPQNRKIALAMRWIIGSARGRSGTDMANCLAREFIEAFNDQGSAIKKRGTPGKELQVTDQFKRGRTNPGLSIDLSHL